MYKAITVKPNQCTTCRECRFHSATGHCSLADKPTDWSWDCILVDGMQKHDAELIVQLMRDEMEGLKKPGKG